MLHSTKDHRQEGPTSRPLRENNFASSLNSPARVAVPPQRVKHFQNAPGQFETLPPSLTNQKTLLKQTLSKILLYESISGYLSIYRKKAFLKAQLNAEDGMPPLKFPQPR